mgnify:CR=1 FL=1
MKNVFRPRLSELAELMENDAAGETLEWKNPGLDIIELTRPDTPDPADVTLPSDKSGIDGTVLHLRKTAATRHTNTGDDKATIRAVLAFPRITFRQMT